MVPKNFELWQADYLVVLAIIRLLRIVGTQCLTFRHSFKQLACVVEAQSRHARHDGKS